MTTSQAPQHKPVGFKELVTSLVIAFMLAFVFRGFIIEGFQIPTGSMAPTLLGKHIRFTSPHNGYSWTTGPWDNYNGTHIPTKIQGANGLRVTDPMTGLDQTESSRKLASGDRVFVLKYLPVLHEPSRWDVVVFKNPGTHENYIKRLVGLPGEQLAFVDGDLFTRPFVEGQTATAGFDAWEATDWTPARKSERVQRIMFQDVFDSRYAPVTVDPSYRAPFESTTPGWDGLRTDSSYTYSNATPTILQWNNDKPITDRNSYNQTSIVFDMSMSPTDPKNGNRNFRPFYASDIALSADIQLDGSHITTTPTISARGHQFRAIVNTADGSASVEMKSDASDSAWQTLDSTTFAKPSASDIISIEFWHVDQALWLFINDALACGGPEAGAYQMTPLALATAATSLDRAALEAESAGGAGVIKPGVLARPEIYKPSTVAWNFDNGPFTLHNVRVQRDINYRNMPAEQSGRATRGGHPNFFPTLNDDEFFMCGDNSSRSQDSRLWAQNEIVPWVERLVDDRAGMVNEDLVVGKAFVVYWPSMLKESKVPAPDAGRVRWIW